jgi:hypothetical protein
MVKKWLEAGVQTPEGQYFPFNNDEKMVFVRDGNERKPMVRLHDGSEVAFPAWRKARQEDIQAAFRKVQPQYLGLYMDLLTEYPELEEIDVMIASAAEKPVLGKTIGRFVLPDDHTPNPTIQLNQSAHAAAMEMDTTTISEIAKRIGVEPEILQKNPEMLQTFIFLHELGHAYDFVKNYLHNPMAADKNFNPTQAMMQQSKHEMATMLIPGLSPSQVLRLQEQGRFDLVEHYNKHKLFFWAKGIRSPEKLFEVMQVNYRNLPKEQFADNFAVQILHKQWQKLKFGKIVGTPSSGKIH